MRWIGINSDGYISLNLRDNCANQRETSNWIYLVGSDFRKILPSFIFKVSKEWLKWNEKNI